MQKIAPETEAEAEDPDFKPLTAQEAQEWRSRNPAVSVWRLVGMQAVAGVLVALAAWLLSGQMPVAWSAGYGALAVVLAAAPKLVPQLSWLALLVGMVVTMKTYWIALMVRPGVRKTD